MIRTTTVQLPKYMEELKKIYYEIRKDEFFWEQSISEDDFEKDIEDQKIIIAISNDKAIGFLSYFEDTGFIRNLFIKKTARGKGSAFILLSTLATEENLFPLTLKCVKQNKKALKFYREAGFFIANDGIQDGTEYFLLQLNKLKVHPPKNVKEL